jgi:hypothetical protein
MDRIKTRRARGAGVGVTVSVGVSVEVGVAVSVGVSVGVSEAVTVGVGPTNGNLPPGTWQASRIRITKIDRKIPWGLFEDTLISLGGLLYQ